MISSRFGNASKDADFGSIDQALKTICIDDAAIQTIRVIREETIQECSGPIYALAHFQKEGDVPPEINIGSLIELWERVIALLPFKDKEG